MKSRFLKVLLFFFLVVFLDRIIGAICKKLYHVSNDYTIHRLCYTLDSTKEDILIFGSSRAENHIIPNVINQFTSLSSYNCGFGGEGLLFSLIQLKETLKRYKPKLIVLEVSPNVLIDSLEQQKLKMLLPFNKKDPLIFEVLIKDEMFERVKLLSAIYPYNSTIASLITGRYKQNIDTTNGFQPLDGVIDTTGLSAVIKKYFPNSIIPSERLNILKQFITLCYNHHLKIAVVVSPVYKTNRNLDEMTKQIELACLEYKYERLYFLNYSKLDTVYQHARYFKDYLHLNYEGATVFSEIISKKLKEIIGT